MQKPSLILVPTPIGNLADITLRALEVLKSVDIVLAEDTRTSRVLLNHYGVKTPLSSFHTFNEHKRLDSLIVEMKAGKQFALISDAGTPGISDPGFLIARAALENDLVVEALPGPTALVPALLKSGFAADRFVFEGFLPLKKGRQTRIKSLADEKRTIILYESPHRLLKTLNQLYETLGSERNISVSREITKKFEETLTGSFELIIQHFEKTPPKGEFVIVISAAAK